jgi:hypothetical protein
MEDAVQVLGPARRDWKKVGDTFRLDLAANCTTWRATLVRSEATVVEREMALSWSDQDAEPATKAAGIWEAEVNSRTTVTSG